MTPDADGPVSFETDIKPLFRERDRASMEFAFDLWSHDDVSQKADPILARLGPARMPCDGAWPRPQVDLFERWVASGKPRLTLQEGRWEFGHAVGSEFDDDRSPSALLLQEGGL